MRRGIEVPGVGRMCNVAQRTYREYRGVQPFDMHSVPDEATLAQADRALRISELSYRRLFETAQDGILLLNAETAQIEDVNPFLVELLGYSREEFLGKKLWEIGAFKDNALNREAFAELQEKGYIRYEDLPLETRQGKRVAVEFVSNVYLVEDLRVIQCNIRDITERKRAERALRASEQFAEATIDAASAHMCVLDPHGTILAVNKAWRDFHVGDGGNPESRSFAVGANYLKVCAEATGDDASGADTMAEGIRAVLRHETDKFVLEYPCHSRGGRHWFIARVTRFRDDSGNAVVAHENISDRKAAEADLREAKDRLAVIVDSAMDAIITVDDAQNIVVFNAAACAMFGCTAAAAIGGPLNRFVPERFRAAHAGQMRAFGAGRESTRAMGRFGHTSGLRADGAEFPMEASISHVPLQGRQLYSVILRDISKRVAADLRRDALEAQVREVQKMEALGTLAGGVAHDFNNILGVIIGNVALAREQARNPALLEESLVEIAKAGQRAKLLVNQILIFSRREAQSLVAQPMRPILEEAARLLRATLPASVRLKVELPDTPIHARVDASQYLQVLINLVTNAWHALRSASGSIGLKLDVVQLDEPSAARIGGLPAGLYMRTSVSDDGTGMDEATQARVFEPFFTTKPKGSGTGLGLAVVHGIVKAHQGAIMLTSTPGEGSVFEIYLPATVEPAEAATPTFAAPPSAKVQGKHVLYVDDDEAMVFIICRLLRARGFRVSGFERVAEALAAVRGNPADFDLVVSDFNMPEASGLDVALAVGGIRSGLPVVITSGFITEALREGARAAGVLEVVYKPNSAEELVAVIGRILEEK